MISGKIKTTFPYVIHGYIVYKFNNVHKKEYTGKYFYQLKETINTCYFVLYCYCTYFVVIIMNVVY